MGQVDNATISRKEARKGRRGRPVGGATDSEFINRELSDKETLAYRVWRDDFQTVMEIFDAAIQEEYKFSQKWDSYSESPCCFMFPPGDSANAGFILTGRGGNAYRALAECLYKHSAIFGGDWQASVGTVPGPDDPDW